MSSHTTALATAAPSDSPELETERYLHHHIPLSSAMGVRVLLATTGRVELAAPLAPNINHQATVFGGSASAAATLSAWTLVHIGLRQANVRATIVIQRNSMRYEAPITGEFKAVCTLTDDAAWHKFLKMVERRGRGRVNLKAHLEYAGRCVASFEGDFVALRD